MSRLSDLYVCGIYVVQDVYISVLALYVTSWLAEQQPLAPAARDCDGLVVPPVSSVYKKERMYPRNMKKSNELEADTSEPQDDAKISHKQNVVHAAFSETESSRRQLTERERTSSEPVNDSLSLDPDLENMLRFKIGTDQQSYGEAEYRVPSRMNHLDRFSINAVTHHMVLPSKRHARRQRTVSHRKLATAFTEGNTNINFEQPELTIQRDQSLQVSKYVSHCQVMKPTISYMDQSPFSFADACIVLKIMFSQSRAAERYL